MLNINLKENNYDFLNKYYFLMGKLSFFSSCVDFIRIKWRFLRIFSLVVSRQKRDFYFYFLNPTLGNFIFRIFGFFGNNF